MENKEPSGNMICRLQIDRCAKIVATIGPATRSLETIKKLLEFGVNVARLNMSHGSHESHAEVIGYLRAASEDMKQPLAILLDLSGPKIRTGKLKGGKAVELLAGSKIAITTQELEGDENRVSTTYTSITKDVRIGDRILLDDGLLELSVEEISETEVTCRVVHGGLLGERKGINLPGVALSTPSITEKDKRDLEFGIENNVDYVALSFVRKAKDCIEAKELIAKIAKEKGTSKPPLIAKIEKAEALKELDDIIQVVDGIMVARGDLGIETATENVPVYQKEIIRKANIAGKIVITATQMLQSMIDNPRPTRAEASDVANAILDGTDAVMLSGETASGAFPIEAVRTMDRIIRFTEEAVYKERFQSFSRYSLFGQHTGSYNRALAEAAVFAAEEVGSPIILVFTEGGKMARRVAALRPRQTIIALTHVMDTYRKLSAVWGVKSYLLRTPIVSDQMMNLIDQAVTQLEVAQPSETIVMIAGELSGVPLSNIVKLHRVGK